MVDLQIVYEERSSFMYGRVVDLRSRDLWFKTHQRHCVVPLSKTLYPQLSTGSKARKTGKCSSITAKFLTGT